MRILLKIQQRLCFFQKRLDKRHLIPLTLFFWITDVEGSHVMLLYGTLGIEISIDKSIRHVAQSVRLLYRLSLWTHRKIY